MELVKLDKGELKAEIKFVNGEIVAESYLDASGIKAKVEVKIPTDYFLDELAKKIPGTIDDQVLGLIKIALKAV